MPLQVIHLQPLPHYSPRGTGGSSREGAGWHLTLKGPMGPYLQLKQMEVQLEEEYEDKQKVLREKRELEGKLATLSDQVSGDCWLRRGEPGAGRRWLCRALPGG